MEPSSDMFDLDEVINTSQYKLERKRASSIKMQKLGFCVKDICNVLGVSDTFVSKWKLVYKKDGIKGLKLGYKGRKPYLTESSREDIRLYILNNDHIDLQDLLAYIDDKHGVVFKSKQSYYDILSDARKSWHKSENENPKNDQVKVLVKRKEINDSLEEKRLAIETKQLIAYYLDECHLLWGDTLGYVWGTINTPIKVAMSNAKERQTYYGAMNCLIKEFILQSYPCGNGENTVLYIKYLQSLNPGTNLILIWDNASYHRYGKVREYLWEINKGLEKKDWKVTCVLFETNAPEQNPIEDVWLKGKNHLRRFFWKNRTFGQVKNSFSDYLSNKVFNFAKCDWYFVPRS